LLPSYEIRIKETQAKGKKLREGHIFHKVFPPNKNLNRTEPQTVSLTSSSEKSSSGSKTDPNHNDDSDTTNDTANNVIVQLTEPHLLKTQSERHPTIVTGDKAPANAENFKVSPKRLLEIKQQFSKTNELFLKKSQSQNVAEIPDWRTPKKSPEIDRTGEGNVLGSQNPASPQKQFTTGSMHIPDKFRAKLKGPQLNLNLNFNGPGEVEHGSITPGKLKNGVVQSKDPETNEGINNDPDMRKKMISEHNQKLMNKMSNSSASKKENTTESFPSSD
jgi:hypothetical protein